MRLLGLCAVLGLLVVASTGSADAAAKHRPENYQRFLTQVSRGEVKTAVLVPKQKTLRARLKHGGRYLVKYKTADKRQLLASLHAKHVHVAFAKPGKKHTTHRLRRRYIALAVVGLALFALAGWVFIRRRTDMVRREVTT